MIACSAPRGPIPGKAERRHSKVAPESCALVFCGVCSDVHGDPIRWATLPGANSGLTFGTLSEPGHILAEILRDSIVIGLPAIVLFVFANLAKLSSEDIVSRQPRGKTINGNWKRSPRSTSFSPPCSASLGPGM